MNKLVLFPLIGLGLIPLTFVGAEQQLTDSGQIEWKFCNGTKTLHYEIFNGTLHDTVHLKLQGTPECTGSDQTQFQYQLFHQSNNHTDVTLTISDDLEDEIIDVRVVGRDYLENFQFNSTHQSLEFSDFTHDKNGLVTIIMDLK